MREHKSILNGHKSSLNGHFVTNPMWYLFKKNKSVMCSLVSFLFLLTFVFFFFTVDMDKLIFSFLLTITKNPPGFYLFINASVITCQVVKWEMRTIETEKSCCKNRCVKNLNI